MQFKPGNAFYWLTVSVSTNQCTPLICVDIYKQIHVDFLVLTAKQDHAMIHGHHKILNVYFL